VQAARLWTRKTRWHKGIMIIRLWAREFYEVIVDEAEGRINYHLIEIEIE